AAAGDGDGAAAGVEDAQVAAGGQDGEGTAGVVAQVGARQGDAVGAGDGQIDGVAAGGGVGLLDGRAQRDRPGRRVEDVGEAVDVEDGRHAAVLQRFEGQPRLARLRYSARGSAGEGGANTGEEPRQQFHDLTSGRGHRGKVSGAGYAPRQE